MVLTLNLHKEGLENPKVMVLKIVTHLGQKYRYSSSKVRNRVKGHYQDSGQEYNRSENDIEA